MSPGPGGCDGSQAAGAATPGTGLDGTRRAQGAGRRECRHRASAQFRRPSLTGSGGPASRSGSAPGWAGLPACRITTRAGFFAFVRLLFPGLLPGRRPRRHSFPGPALRPFSKRAGLRRNGASPLAFTASQAAVCVPCATHPSIAPCRRLRLGASGRGPPPLARMRAPPQAASLPASPPFGACVSLSQGLPGLRTTRRSGSSLRIFPQNQRSGRAFFARS